MNRRTLLASVGSALGLSGVTGVTAAQSDDAMTMTESGTETESGQTYAAQLSPTVRLISAKVTNSETTDTEPGDGEKQRTATIRLKIEAEIPAVVSTSDVFGAVSDAGENGIVQTEQTERTIPSGTTNVEVQVGAFKGVVGVGIGVPNGNPTIVRRKLPTDDGGGLSESLEETSAAAGWAGGVSVTTAMGVLAAYRVKNNDPDEPRTPE